MHSETKKIHVTLFIALCQAKEFECELDSYGETLKGFQQEVIRWHLRFLKITVRNVVDALERDKTKGGQKDSWNTLGVVIQLR